MRTTVSINDQLLAAAKERARRRGKTLGQVLDAALRRELAENEVSPPVPVPVFRGGSGPRPGLELESNRALAEALDEDVDLNRRR
jgi:hypothetical protein